MNYALIFAGGTGSRMNSSSDFKRMGISFRRFSKTVSP